MKIDLIHSFLTLLVGVLNSVDQDTLSFNVTSHHAILCEMNKHKIVSNLRIPLKIVSMIRKYHNHKLQTNSWHREKEPHNNQETRGRQTKQSNQFSLPHQDDCKTRMDMKQHTTKHRTITESHNGTNNQHRINNIRTIALERTAAKATGA